MNLDRFGFKAKNSYGHWFYSSMQYKGEGNEKIDENYYGMVWGMGEGELLIGPYLNIRLETLCQSTGIRDSDGDLIYENDTVQVIQGSWGSDNYSSRYFTICFHEPSKPFEMHGEADDYSLSTLIIWMNQGAKCFVVGNKWDREDKDAISGKETNKD